MKTNEKIAALRSAMQDNKIDCYIVNTADDHQSEYLSDYYKERAWLTGFTGSAGTALVTVDKALLWADGRYFIQAERQISDSEFELMKMATPGYPKLEDWLVENLQAGMKVAMNEETCSQRRFEALGKKLQTKDIELKAVPSLIDALWKDRPALPQGEIFEHKLEFTGKTASEKVKEIREIMAKDQVEAHIVVGLDDVAWLYNFRGSDVQSNPVALAFALLTKEEAYLFIDEAKVNPKMKEYFTEQNVTVLPYKEVSQKLAELTASKISLEKHRISTKLYQSLPKEIEILDKQSYVTTEKSCLNEVELKNQKASYERDSAAITRFLFWLKREVSKQTINELSAAEKLHELRSAGKNYIEDSFTAISAYGANAAMMHYAPTAEAHSDLEAKSFYLIDSGGQYFDGTTDITRTIALGELTDEEKTDFTLTLMSHIDLARAIFLKGKSGRDLDILARQPMWENHMDYKCGTGHSVGYVLGVHEGVHGFSSNTPLKLGMIITNEPGVYKEGKHGIRLENDFVVVSDGKNADGDEFYKFEVISFVPLDLEAIKVEMLSPVQKSWLNAYHQQCYDILLPFMKTEEEKEQLKEACRSI